MLNRYVLNLICVVAFLGLGMPCSAVEPEVLSKLVSLSLASVHHTSSGLTEDFSSLGNSGESTMIGDVSDRLIVKSMKFKDYGSEQGLSPTGVLEATEESGETPRVLDGPYVYPSPMRMQGDGGTIWYKLNRDIAVELHVYDMYAHRIMKWTFAAGANGGTEGRNYVAINQQTSFDGTPLSSGVYFLALVHNGEILAKGKMAVKP